MPADFSEVIGRAALAIWPTLPRDVQETLFETAVGGREDLRQPLAIFLHDHHPRTAHPAKPVSTT